MRDKDIKIMWAVQFSKPDSSGVWWLCVNIPITKVNKPSCWQIWISVLNGLGFSVTSTEREQLDCSHKSLPVFIWKSCGPGPAPSTVNVEVFPALAVLQMWAQGADLLFEALNHHSLKPLCCLSEQGSSKSASDSFLLPTLTIPSQKFSLLRVCLNGYLVSEIEY